jgi:uncharacterized membrane protein YvbJ
MNCPNCGLPNPDTAKFCSNCGTSFVNAPPPPYGTQQTYQAPSPTFQNPSQYLPPPTPGPAKSSLGRNIGLGCLILLAIFLFLGLSCTRACFGLRHHRYVTRYSPV